MGITVKLGSDKDENFYMKHTDRVDLKANQELYERILRLTLKKISEEYIYYNEDSIISIFDKMLSDRKPTLEEKREFEEFLSDENVIKIINEIYNGLVIQAKTREYKECIKKITVETVLREISILNKTNITGKYELSKEIINKKYFSDIQKIKEIVEKYFVESMGEKNFFVRIEGNDDLITKNRLLTMLDEFLLIDGGILEYKEKDYFSNDPYIELKIDGSYYLKFWRFKGNAEDEIKILFNT